MEEAYRSEVILLSRRIESKLAELSPSEGSYWLEVMLDHIAILALLERVKLTHVDDLGVLEKTKVLYEDVVALRQHFDLSGHRVDPSTTTNSVAHELAKQYDDLLMGR